MHTEHRARGVARLALILSFPQRIESQLADLLSIKALQIKALVAPSKLNVGICFLSLDQAMLKFSERFAIILFVQGILLLREAT